MKRRIGIFSGTFDPVHSGHIAFAKEAMEVCQLDKVVFLPEQTPRFKHSVTDISHRVELLKLATNGIKGLDVIAPTSAQFTVRQTLPELHNMFKGTVLTLLIGSDVVKTFPHRWEDLGILLGDVSLAIGMRARDTFDEVLAVLNKLEANYKIKIDYALIKAPDLDVASSHVRNGIADVSRLQPDIVDYINKHKLYT